MTEYKKRLKEYYIGAKNTDFPAVKITSSKDAADYARQFYGEDIHIYESMFIILLNRVNNTSGFAKISQGGVCQTIVDTKIISKYVVDTLSSGIILIHNHPSGRVSPSESDRDFTERIKNAVEMFECKVLDSIILSETNYYSFVDNEIL